jgi:hypothetical protein
MDGTLLRATVKPENRRLDADPERTDGEWTASRSTG